MKTEVEGRLPIRRPSEVQPMMQASNLVPFATTAKKGSFGKEKREEDEAFKSDSKDDKTELDAIVDKQNEDREDLNSFLSRSIFTNKFQVFWAIVLFLTHTYHLLALFWYLGLPDFPEDELLALQTFFEMVLILDILIRYTIKRCSSEVWESMWLLHDFYEQSTKSGLITTIIGSLPIMTILSLSTSNTDILHAFWVSVLRLPKLLRFREVNKISQNYSRVDRERSRGYSSFYIAGYGLFLATHIIG